MLSKVYEIFTPYMEGSNRHAVVELDDDYRYKSIDSIYDDWNQAIQQAVHLTHYYGGTKHALITNHSCVRVQGYDTLEDLLNCYSVTSTMECFFRPKSDLKFYRFSTYTDFAGHHKLVIEYNNGDEFTSCGACTEKPEGLPEFDIKEYERKVNERRRNAKKNT